uniref:NADH-ubiquinone oxidoreductase chain 6 n=1 Tax=Gekko swinhonis TaxID=146912 RepID=I2DA74_9SAUR|nr:NADH dehydrogenase subunit 6 [Gekko swinhonis]AFJ79067.1 NADH dehydrogenase subunit 6 [Gekko swinhonis]
MTYLIFCYCLCLIIGALGVAANPSPLFGAAALVFCALGGCGVLVGLGGSFVGIVLFLIYLGGMLVVFAYSVALAADSYPETWVDYSIFVYVLGYIVLVLFLGWWLMELVVEVGVDGGGLFNTRSDFSGVVVLFSLGGCLLLLSGWGLLLALFVVLELTRGRAYGGLRVP